MQYLRFKTNLLGAAPPEASALMATLAGALGFAGAGGGTAPGGAGSAGAALSAAAASGRKADGAAQTAAPAPAAQSKGGASSGVIHVPLLLHPNLTRSACSHSAAAGGGERAAARLDVRRGRARPAVAQSRRRLRVKRPREAGKMPQASTAGVSYQLITLKQKRTVYCSSLSSLSSSSSSSSSTS
jgi:hypothetical protein